MGTQDNPELEHLCHLVMMAPRVEAASFLEVVYKAARNPEQRSESLLTTSSALEDFAAEANKTKGSQSSSMTSGPLLAAATMQVFPRCLTSLLYPRLASGLLCNDDLG